MVGPLLGLPAGFSAAVGLVCVFCGATNTLVASIVLAAELFSGAGFELMALACGLSYMFSGYHSLYSSQGFRTSKHFFGIPAAEGRKMKKKFHGCVS